jgi:hypothetical protein
MNSTYYQLLYCNAELAGYQLSIAYVYFSKLYMGISPL